MVVINSVKKEIFTQEDLYKALALGNKRRHVASTQVNSRSSRSHTIFVISYQQQTPDGRKQTGKLNIIDLAGSEKVGASDNTSEAKAEGTKINMSLSQLQLCVKQIATKQEHVSYMDSMLTKFLMDSLTGNCLTSILITASKKKEFVEESISALTFGSIACQVKTKVQFNIELSREEIENQLEQLSGQLAACKEFLDQRGLPMPEAKSGGSSSYNPFPTTAAAPQMIIHDNS